VSMNRKNAKQRGQSRRVQRERRNPKSPWVPPMVKEAALRLKVAAGHLDAVRRMVDEDAYCVDLMKQLSAVQGTLQRVQQIFLRNHLSSCVSDAIRNGMGDAIDDEARPALPGQQARCRGEEQPVTPSQLWTAGFALEDLHLVAQDEDLDLAVTPIAGGRQTQDGAQHHVEE
jgi:DNA-binding FrmR family transcriptional regulator